MHNQHLCQEIISKQLPKQVLQHIKLVVKNRRQSGKFADHTSDNQFTTETNGGISDPDDTKKHL